MRGPSRNPRGLQKGDLVELTWTDVQSLDRQTVENLRDLPELTPTRSYGVVIKQMASCIVIAHELGDEQADGYHIEMIPHKIIDRAKVYGRVRVDL
jgi:hypothetical protein